MSKELISFASAGLPLTAQYILYRGILAWISR